MPQTQRYGIELPLSSEFTWTNPHRLTRPLHLPRRPRSAPEVFLTEHEHTAQLRRCLHETNMPIEYRLAGTLALLFGLPLTRITNLRTEQIVRVDTATFLAVGARRLRLPPRVAAPRRWQILDGHTTPSPWLFPGQSPTRPASSSKMHGGLRQHGITVLAGRNSDRTALADLTGIHISTAVAWSQRANATGPTSSPPAPRDRPLTVVDAGPWRLPSAQWLPTPYAERCTSPPSRR